MNSEWRICKIGDVVRSVDRREVPRPGNLYRQLGVRLWGEGVYERATIDGAATLYHHLSVAKNGDIIINKIWARNGSVSVIPPELDGCYCSPEFLLLKPIDKLLGSGWFFWLTKTRDFWQDCEKKSQGTSGKNRIRPEGFLSIEIPCPAIGEQDRIVAMLDAIAERIRSINELRQEILQDSQALLQSVFHRLIQGAPYRPLAEIAPIVRRPVQIDPDAVYPELGVRSFGKGTFHKQPLPGSEVGIKKLYCIHPGDLVLSNVFAWEGAIAVAAPRDAGRFGSHRFITCVAHPDTALAAFLCFFLLTNEGIEQVREASPGGAGRNRTLGLAKLERIRVPVPELRRQQEFCVLQSRVSALFESQARSQLELDALIPAVLDKAFKGEL